ncbi:MAG: Nif11-like leader peptide family RiPP precursor [bacterium]
MATQRAKEFFKLVNHDIVLRQQLENAPTPEARRKVIDAAGYADVTKEDLQATLTEQSNLSPSQVAAVGELSDSELEAVAGGATTAWLTAVIMAIVA